ncbi:hypothetical protein [Plantactinospora sp. KLBMP9567]|uniref:hypothetical protein n=1 Tax=Plantactinospora sp. KLBMP9567 TaxID=3085900 RepID=UPI00298202DB|nr:hypothetical protein [Plantactinospora sp. KLBMP9567]MDW5324336.1 hypothetical protein [Plantactinospora sp. KLBMP9567]
MTMIGLAQADDFDEQRHDRRKDQDDQPARLPQQPWTEEPKPPSDTFVEDLRKDAQENAGRLHNVAQVGRQLAGEFAAGLPEPEKHIVRGGAQLVEGVTGVVKDAYQMPPSPEWYLDAETQEVAAWVEHAGRLYRGPVPEPELGPDESTPAGASMPDASEFQPFADPTDVVMTRPWFAGPGQGSESADDPATQLPAPARAVSELYESVQVLDAQIRHGQDMPTQLPELSEMDTAGLRAVVAELKAQVKELVTELEERRAEESRQVAEETATLDEAPPALVAATTDPPPEGSYQAGYRGEPGGDETRPVVEPTPAPAVPVVETPTPPDEYPPYEAGYRGEQPRRPEQ